MTFAHSITTTEPFGVATIGEQVVRVNDDGTAGDEIVAAAGNQLRVDPASSADRIRRPRMRGAFVPRLGPGALRAAGLYAATSSSHGAQFRLAEG